MSELRIPLIRALDLRWPDKYMAPSWRDPEDAYRAEMRLENRRRAAKLPPRTHDQILHRTALHELRFDHGGKPMVLKTP